MKAWNQAPLVRLILPFVVGILSAIYFPYQTENILYLILTLFAIITTSVFIPKLNFSYRKSFWFGFIINTLLFLSAYQLTIYKTEKFSQHHFSKIQDASHLFYARLTDSYSEKNTYLKAVVEILATKNGDRWMGTSGKAMIYLKKDSLKIPLKYGDELLLKADFKEVSGPQNPGEFNYKRFLAFHNAFHQAYVKKGEWVALERNTGNPIFRYSIELRRKLLTILIDNHLVGDEYSVGAALLLGYVDKLDADIISAYASTGTLHVLSVSGLHVAIVYIVFSWFLFFLDKIKNGFIIKSLLLITFLWCYATLTGLSPAVLRAATMFSFIIIAKAYNKHTNIYNTLAISAFCLLLINPYLIMDVGFQLSYLAVIGIVFMQPKINKWFEPDSWLLQQIWMITSVSIAAQLATFPLGLYYFHQFPNYFLFSNLLAIPISTKIIYLGMAVFVFSKISFVIHYLSILFSSTIWFLNTSLKWIETLPYASVQGVSISIFDAFLLYGLVVLVFCYFSFKKYHYLMYAFLATILILSLQVSKQIEQLSQKKFIIYNVPKVSAMNFISAKNSVLLTDSLFLKDESKIRFHIKPNWWNSGVTSTKLISADIQTADLKISTHFIQFFSKKIVLLKDKKGLGNNMNKSCEPLKIDYLVVSNNAKMSIEDSKKWYNAKTIVFDSSNLAYKINQWKKECSKLHQPCYSVVDSGALIVDL